jgi:ribosomal protein S18 acetylase RimI-like enzyme
MAGAPTEIVPARQLSSEGLGLVAKLFREALPDYYELLPVPEAERLAVIVRQIETPGSELAESFAALGAKIVIGAYCALDVERLTPAQLLASAEVFRHLAPERRPSVKQALRAFREQFEPPPAASVYLARIAVAESARGQGIASSLLGHLAERAGPRPLSLHVRRDNLSAISLYRRHGFAEIGSSSRAYALMQTGKA